MEQEAAHRRCDGATSERMQQMHSSEKYPSIKVQIQKTFLEGKGVVFYEVNIHSEASGSRGDAQCSPESSCLRSNTTILRRYKHFKFFHKRLSLLLVKGEVEERGGSNLLKQILPKLPPLRPKLLVDHSSPIFVSDRSRALEVYLERILSNSRLLGLVLKSPDLSRWLTDLPELFYPPSSQGNCPYLYRCWQVYPPCAIPVWEDGYSKENAPEDRNHTALQSKRDHGGDTLSR